MAETNFVTKLFGVGKNANKQTQIPREEGYRESQVTVKNFPSQNSTEQVKKGMNGNKNYVEQKIFDPMDINPGFKQKPSIKGTHDLHRTLRQFSSNAILNAIILTRANQVATYCVPSSSSDTGMGYQVRMKDMDDEPSSHDKANIKRIEKFLDNTASFKDQNRDTFTSFCKKVVRDTYIYDQVNFEKVYDSDGNFIKFDMVDPTTIYLATDKNGKLIKEGERFVQVLDGRVVAKFNEKEMAFAVRNPRSDIQVNGYGLSEAEIGLKQIIAHENTETFNDRFFSHGGTTRGILLIKAGQQQSTRALDIFRREWKNSLSGINGSWQIPVVSADDVKFINMTPQANDMQFEKWLNYLINLLSALYGIDPAEINFPNTGGATSSRGGSLNEGNQKEKNQASQNKGLQPLLKFIEDTVNTYIIAEFGDKYRFEFKGGDLARQLEKIKIKSEEGKVFKTVNEIRVEFGLDPVEGGDVILNGVHIQAIGQEMQREQFEYQKQQDRLNRLLEEADNPEPQADVGNSVQDTQQGLDGDSSSVNGKGDGQIGKDGQSKEQENTNSAKIGGKEGRSWDK